MPKKPKGQELLVEGDNDKHVIWALCEKHKVPETFDVKAPKNIGMRGDGIDALMEGIPLRLKQHGFQTLGIVMDADDNLQARWEKIKKVFQDSGYDDMPEKPAKEGFVKTCPDKPDIGVWIMPDNSLPGQLEDFVRHLVPKGDPLIGRAHEYVSSVQSEGLNRYPIHQSAKALICSWLACQKTPCIPMGRAITANVLEHDGEIANRFVNWLNRLFNQHETR